MMKNYIYILFIFLSLSCVQMDGPVGSYGQEEQVDVSLKFAAKSGQEDDIYNFWLIQYAGTSDDAKLTGEPKYYQDFGLGGQVKLVASAMENTVVMLANTFEPSMTFYQGSTLGDLKKRARAVSENDSLLSSDPSGSKHIVLSAVQTPVVKEGITIEFELIRNIAEFRFNIVNEAEDLVINSWQLRSVSAASYYFNSYSLPDIYPAFKDFVPVDYPPVRVDAGLGKGASQEYVAYLPVNKCGVKSEVSNEKYKNLYAPYGATYLQVNAVADGEPLEYRFYLGDDKNSLGDFNILPNVSYSYDVTISAKGDPESDSRVSTPALVDYSQANDEIANCYVINPLEISGVTRRYRIPVKIVDIFWGGKYGYEDVPEYVLGPSDPSSLADNWTVELIACNFDNTDSRLTITKSSGEGSYDAETSRLQYFEIQAEPGLSGNAIVALRKSSGGPVLWSWHLWITDYAPEQAYDKMAQKGVFSYEVDGGAVHRYEGEMWENEYAGRFIMDRNLGALSTDYVGTGNGALYYQFGRKDPLFGDAATGASLFRTVNYDNVYDAAEPTSTLRYSVHNPLHCIYRTGRGAWTEGNKYNPDVFDGNILWQDPYTSGSKYPGTVNNKSVFDPCPPGYCVPKSGIWSDFRRNDSKEYPTTNIRNEGGMQRGFPPYAGTAEYGKGGYYWPYDRSQTGGGSMYKKPVYYTSSGYKDGGGIASVDVYLYCLAANPHSESNSRGLKMGEDRPGEYDLSTDYSLGRNLGLPVRCITVRDAD